MRASDVPTTETLAFVQAHSPPASAHAPRGPAHAPSARILEVGGGDGALASRLQETGYQVVSLDSSAEAVALARQRGVDARVVRWPDFEDGPFDVVLFTRSLHHIEPLPPAVGQAKKLLRERGKVLVEDFAYKEIEPLAVEWLYELLAVLDAGGLLRRDADGFADQFLRQGGSLAAWHATHDPHLHSAEVMLSCLRDHFAAVDVATAPYLYRYVCADLEEGAAGHRLGSRILEMEKRFAATAPAPLIGRRYVCTTQG
jgi:SAM-dependent methyltransferase